MKIISLLRVTLVLSVCGTACKKSLRAVEGTSNTDTTATIINYNSADVYVAGSVTVQSGTGFTQAAAYWKDGVLTVLGDGQTESSATGIVVSGNDVYVTGIIRNDTAPLAQACLWKDGVQQKLSPDSGYSATTCIALRGSDVLVGGAIYDKGTRQGITVYSPDCVYWDNGVPVKIPGASNITSIAVSGQDVYVAGAYQEPFTYVGKDTLGGGTFAAYWKNAAPPVYLVQPTEFPSSSCVNGIAVNGQNVYTAGFAAATDNDANYWYNSTQTTLSQSNFAGNAAAIAVNGTDVYIGGNLIESGYPVAAYWKNNVITMLSAAAINSAAASQANAIAVNASGVYAAGSLFKTQTLYNAAVLWVDGTAVQLTNGGNLGANANAIFVVPK